MAWLYWALDWDFEASSRELALALELGPSDPEAHIQAALLGVVEDRELAFAHAELALRLDPLSESTHFQLAWCYYFGGEPARALEQSRTTLERFPDSLLTWYVLGLSHLSLGQVHEGVTALEKATSLSRESFGLGYLGCAYAFVGRQEDARAILDELLTRKAERFVPLKPFILLYTALGDIDRALDALEDAMIAPARMAAPPISSRYFRTGIIAHDNTHRTIIVSAKVGDTLILASRFTRMIVLLKQRAGRDNLAGAGHR
jgi:tetratricopeptide (TPR) repeat protein